METREIDKIIARYNADPQEIMAMFMEIQDKEGYLPKSALSYLADKLHLRLAQLYRLATFYEAFNLKPQGDHQIHVCMGTACHVRGAPQVLDKLQQSLGITAGEVSSDGSFGLKTVNCLGACALGPVVIIDGEYCGHSSPLKMEKILKKYKKHT